MNRQIAIINYLNDRTVFVKQFVEQMLAFNVSDNITVFVKSDEQKQQFEKYDVDVIVFPESSITRSHAKNYVSRYFKDEVKHHGFLHVVEDKIKLLSNPNKFMNDIEHMMNMLDLKSWFNTACDNYNFIYNKYCPRLNIKIDNDKFKELNFPNLIFTSHSNTAWTIFNLTDIQDNELYFDEQYSTPLFYIISYLANKRNTKTIGEIKYMNQYPTVESEHKTIAIVDNINVVVDNNAMLAEDKLFSQAKIDTHSDNMIDDVLEDVLNKLNEKIKKITL